MSEPIREDEEEARAGAAELDLYVQREEAKAAAARAREALAIPAPRRADPVIGAQCDAALDRFRQVVTPELVLEVIEAHDKDLEDMAFVIHQIAKVYEHVTGGQLSKPTYYAETVIAVADDHYTQQLEEALREERALIQGPPPTAEEREKLLAKTAACAASLRRRVELIRSASRRVREGTLSALEALEQIHGYLEVLPDEPAAPPESAPSPPAPA